MTGTRSKDLVPVIFVIILAMKDLQQQVDAWVSQYKIGYWQPFEILARLIEEVGEVGRELNHRFGPKKKKGTEDKAELGDELADVIFTIICLANSQEIDLETAFKRVMAKAYGRDDGRWEKKVNEA